MKHLDAALNVLEPAELFAYEELIELWAWYGSWG